MPREEIYNQATHSVLVDGIPVRDFADGDTPIKVIRPTESSVLTTGLDGSTTSFSRQVWGQLVLELKPTSETLTIFEALFTAQQTSLATLFFCTLRTGVNELFGFFNCSIANIGEVNTGGPSLQSRVVTINSERITPGV